MKHKRTIEGELLKLTSISVLFTRTTKIPNLEFFFDVGDCRVQSHMRSTELCIKTRQSETQQQIPLMMVKWNSEEKEL